MRTDLTTAFISAMQAEHRQPRQLLVFYFPVSGVVRLSDQDLGPADGLDDTYLGLVEEWGELGDVSGSTPAEETSETRQLTLTLFNGGSTPFSDYFLRQEPENVHVELWQWFAGLADSDKALIDRFTVQDPIRFAEASALLELDLVSLNLRYDQPVGDLLLADAWPNAKSADIGKGVDLILGSPGRVPTICAREAPAASLAGSILANTLAVDVYEDLDAAGFSSSGVLQIGAELLRYASRTASRFTITQRGYTSTASEHLDRAAVREVVADHTYIVGRGPVGAISEVQVAGYPAPAGIYTVEPSADPARIVFSQPPYGLGYATGSSFLAMQFDATGSGNSAVQPHLAYDAASDATAARIDASHRTLALLQATVNPDRGEIVKAYLAVEHWADKTYVYDRCRVSVDGIGTVGYLSRPNPADTLDIEAEVDLDHGHTHAIGSEHSHPFIDPAIATQEVPHSHVSNTGGSTTTYYGNFPSSGFSVSAPYEVGALGESYVVTYADAPNRFDGAVIKFNYQDNGASLRIYAIGVAGPWGTWQADVGPGFVSARIPQRNADTPLQLLFEARGRGVTGFADATITDLRVDVEVELDLSNAVAGVQTQIAASGSNVATPSDKHPHDVDDLATANQTIEVTAEQTATHSAVNLFDITAAVNFSWAWFTGRRVTVTYESSADNARVYVLHCFFDIEYRKRQEIFSDDITAEVAGLVDDGAGTITGTPGAEIARPDQVRRYLLQACADLPAAYIDSASHTAAGSRYDALGYRFDGVLPAATPVREAAKTLARQCRSRWFWSGGQAKISLLERLEDWPAQREIDAEDLQLRSLSAERQPVSDLINHVDLFYRRDWTSTASGPAAYDKSTSAERADSIAQHGLLAEPTGWLFDCVADDAMAADLADYYAERRAYAATYYSMAAYLPQFDLEKGDTVQLTAEFGRLRKARARVAAVGRLFGSGKNGAINLVPILAEVVQYHLIEHTLADTVAVAEALGITLGLDGDMADAAHLADQLVAALGLDQAEEIHLGDQLALVIDFAPTIEETVAPADALGVEVGINLADTVAVHDDALVWRTFGFGGGTFGGSGFGGQIIWANRHPDELQLSEQLTVDLEPGAIALTASVADDLYFTCGFGCPLGSGFGLGPFGS